MAIHEVRKIFQAPSCQRLRDKSSGRRVRWFRFIR